MNEVVVKVEKARPEDVGRGIIRLDPNTFLTLQSTHGDVVEIVGKKRTAAKAWRAEHQDWGTDIVRIDGFVRYNAGVDIGDQLIIKKAVVESAEHVVLAPLEGGGNFEFWDDLNSIIKQNLLKLPIVMGDMIPIIGSMIQPIVNSKKEDRDIFFIVAKTEPQEDSILIVNERTKIDIRQSPVRRRETATKGIIYEDVGGLGEKIQRVRETIKLQIKRLFRTQNRSKQ